jgi:gentisate 1,2-dioxygenase
MANNLEAVRQAYYEELGPEALAPLWTVLKSLVTPQPNSPCAPHKWDYANVRAHLMRGGELITAEEAERRVLILENPALPGASCITRTLYAGLQLILPGEVAPCHRHSQSAIRFVLEGSGAYTAVDGERAYMEPFDLILTPNGRWHDHANDSDLPMIWLDGLDIPLVTALDASFAEHMENRAQHPQTRLPEDCQARWGANMRPLRGGGETSSAAAPLFHYPYRQWRAALDRIAGSGDPDPYDAYALEFSNPYDGDAIMPTMSAFCHSVPAGFLTLPQRSTDGMIFVGVEGRGVITINGIDHEIASRDVVVVPAWAERSICAESDLILFSYSDRATQQKLSLWRTDRPSKDSIVEQMPFSKTGF